MVVIIAVDVFYTENSIVNELVQWVHYMDVVNTTCKAPLAPLVADGKIFTQVSSREVDSSPTYKNKSHDWVDDHKSIRVENPILTHIQWLVFYSASYFQVLNRGNAEWLKAKSMGFYSLNRISSSCSTFQRSGHSSNTNPFLRLIILNVGSIDYCFQPMLLFVPYQSLYLLQLEAIVFNLFIMVFFYFLFIQLPLVFSVAFMLTILLFFRFLQLVCKLTNGHLTIHNSSKSLMGHNYANLSLPSFLKSSMHCGGPNAQGCQLVILMSKPKPTTTTFIIFLPKVEF